VEVERFVPGQDVVLAGLIHADRFRPLAFFGEETRFDELGGVRGDGFRLPARLAATEERAIAHACALAARHRFGTSAVFLTFRASADGELTLIEMHLDLAGDFLVEAFLPAAGAEDPIAALIQALTGRGAAPRPALPLVRRSLQPTELRFLFAEDLALDREAKLASLRALPGTLEVNAAIPVAGRGAARRVGYVLSRPDADEDVAFERILGRRAATLAA
jgi:hypothetical protein